MSRSIFGRGESDDPVQGGEFLGPPAKAFSNLPEDLAPEETETNDRTDCQGKDADEPVCQIERALEQESGGPVVGIFDSRSKAEEAVDALEQAGFKSSEVGIVIRGEDAVSGGMITDALGTKDGADAVVGAATGALAGGLFGALVSLALPAVGPVLAGGILATSLGFAAAGTATGGIVGALVGLGTSEKRRGSTRRNFIAAGPS